jgi:ribosome maturation factor RimP
MEITEEVQKLAEKHLKNDSQFIVEVIASVRKKPGKLIVIVDGDNGVTIDDCAALSRALSESLDKNDLLDGSYMLEVSTPGLDHPLKLTRQYRKNIGRKVRVKTKGGTQEGLLTAVTDSEIALGQETGQGKKKEAREMIIPMADIEKIFVLVSFK